MFLTEEELVNNTETKKFSQNVSSSYHLEDRNKNIPKLRFKEYNDEWVEKRIEKVLKIKHGKDQKAIEKDDGIYPILAKSGEIGRSNTFLWDKPCVLIGRKGTINKPQYMDTPFWTVDTLFYSDVFQDNNAKYLYYLFNTINWKKYDESTGVPSLSAKTIERIKIKISNNPKEQEKIASFLTLIDKKIEKQKELVELLKKYKRGLLFSIFSQKLRFKDNNGNDYPAWEEKRLENILKIKHGKSQKEIECNNGEYPILATGGEIGRTNSYLWDKPCVLIGRKGTIDKPQYMDTPFWTVDTLFYSEVFKENNAKYLYYLFNTINWKKYDESTGVPSLSAKTIERIKVTLSISNTEQTIISKILSKFDNKIQQEECILSNLQTYKKGLLQQMFI